LKAAKFGHSIEEIAPQYEKSYYLPNKEQFQLPQTSNARTRHLKQLSHTSHPQLDISDQNGHSVKNVISRPIASESYAKRPKHAKPLKVLSDYDSVFVTNRG
jgi:hypothetical protein